MWTLAEKPPVGFDGPYYRCLCGVHVRTGSNIIAAIVLIIGLTQLFSSVPLGIISIVLALLMLYAHVKVQAWAYWPYLITLGATTAFNLVLGIICAMMKPMDVAQTFDVYPKSKEESYTFYYFFIGGILCLVVTSVWFWYIVYRAYVYTRDVISIPVMDKEELV